MAANNQPQALLCGPRGRNWPVKTASTFAVGSRGKPTELRRNEAPFRPFDVVRAQRFSHDHTATRLEHLFPTGLNTLTILGQHDLLHEAGGLWMQCLSCGAKMQLREVVLADIPTMPGFERHTFRCSACPQVARRLVICRAKMPVVDPLVPSAAPEAPTTNLQTGQPAV